MNIKMNDRLPELEQLILRASNDLWYIKDAGRNGDKSYWRTTH